MSSQLNLFSTAKPIDKNVQCLLSWNVNGVLKRLKSLIELINVYKPDIVCLQETRVEDSAFPHDVLQELGYQTYVNSAGGRNGVSILSKIAGSSTTSLGDHKLFDNGRALLFRSRNVDVLNIYAPNAPFLESDAYREKLQWLRALYVSARTLKRQDRVTAIVGDFNIAPGTTCIHRECLLQYPGFLTDDLIAAWTAFENLGYKHVTPESKPSTHDYTWWSYKDRSYERDVGMQIDHMLLHSGDAVPARARVLRSARELEEPSDHAPILITMH